MPSEPNGSFQAMIQSLKANRALLKRRSWFRDTKTDTSGYRASKPMTFKQGTAEDLERFRFEHAERMRLFQLKKGVAVIFSAAIVLALWLGISYVGEKKAKQKSRDAHPIGEAYFVSYLSQSSDALKQEAYSDAIAYARLAVQCSPKSWYGEFRLAEVYLITCNQGLGFCEEGAELARVLLESHPDNQDVQQLKLLLEGRSTHP